MQRRKKRLRRSLKVEKKRFKCWISAFHFWLTPKHSEYKETNITQLFICKGEKIANAGYLANIADFCESYNLYSVERVGLITQGHPKIPQDAYNFLYNSFINYFRRKQSKNGI